MPAFVEISPLTMKLLLPGCGKLFERRRGKSNFQAFVTRHQLSLIPSNIAVKYNSVERMQGFHEPVTRRLSFLAGCHFAFNLPLAQLF
jgi:hypothetical protein